MALARDPSFAGTEEAKTSRITAKQREYEKIDEKDPAENHRANGQQQSGEPRKRSADSRVAIGTDIDYRLRQRRASRHREGAGNPADN
jgi:hypothetical protein